MKIIEANGHRNQSLFCLVSVMPLALAMCGGSPTSSTVMGVVSANNPLKIVFIICFSSLFRDGNADDIRLNDTIDEMDCDVRARERRCECIFISTHTQPPSWHAKNMMIEKKRVNSLKRDDETSLLPPSKKGFFSPKKKVILVNVLIGHLIIRSISD